MKVAVISNFFPPDFVGGAEIYAHRLGKELVKCGIEISVITSKKSGNDTVEYLDGMKIYRSMKALPFQKLTGKICGYNFNPFAFKLRSILKEIDPDLIHVHNIHTTIMLYPLIKYLERPVIVHVHDHWPICYKGILFNQKRNEFCTGSCVACAFPFGFQTIGLFNLAIRKKLMQKFEAKVNCFITPSFYLKKKLVEWNFTQEKKIKHIPLGIDISEFSQKSYGEGNHIPIILFIGRLVSYKNPSLIVRILPEILKHTECKFTIIGKGPELDVIKDIVKKNNIVEYIDILGTVTAEKLQFILQGADLVVVPSIWNENSPVVIYESLASGTPVFVTNRGGAKELIDEGITGYIIDPSNEEEWKDKIVELLINKRMLHKMSIAAQKKAIQFNIKENAKKVLEIYKSV